MGRLVIDLPDDPHRYLSKMIKDKSDQKVGCYSLFQICLEIVPINNRTCIHKLSIRNF